MHCDYDTFYLYLNEDLVKLNKPVTVVYQGKRIFKGKVRRNQQLINETAELLDEGKVAFGRLSYSHATVTQ